MTAPLSSRCHAAAAALAMGTLLNGTCLAAQAGPSEIRPLEPESWRKHGICPSTNEHTTQCLTKELAGVLPTLDMASQHAGDELAIVQHAEVEALVERFLRHKTRDLELLSWFTWRKSVAGTTGSFPIPSARTLSALCKVWLSGDTVAIARHRDQALTRLAIVERTSPSTLVGKMYFGPLHRAWSSTDQAFYELGIRRVVAYYVSRGNAEQLAQLPGHIVTGNSVSVDLDLFRQASIERT